MLSRVGDKLKKIHYNVIFLQKITILPRFIINTTMKKILLALAFAGLLLASCNKDKGPVEGPALKPEEQKTKIEETAQHLMETVNAQEFQDLAKTVGTFIDRFYLDYDEDGFADVQETFEKMFEEIYYQKENGSVLEVYYNYMLANLQGKVTLGKDKATFSEYNGTMIEWTDEQNDTWTAELKQVGNVREFALNPVEITKAEPESVKVFIKIGIPEKLTVKAAVNGENIATITLTFDVDIDTDDVNISSDGVVEIKKGAVKVTAEVAVDDLTLKVSPIAVDKKIAGTDQSTMSLEFNAALYMGEQLVLGANLSAEATADAEDVLQDIVDVNVLLDVMGEVQVEGDLPSYKGAIDFLQNEGPKGDSKEEWERACNGLNDLFDLVVRYDNTTNVQASLEFEAMEYTYEDAVRYRASPVIVFNDGSRFGLEEIYTEDDMERVDGLMEDIQYWVNSFYALVSTYFEN